MCPTLKCRDCERNFPGARDDDGAICPACGADGPHADRYRPLTCAEARELPREAAGVRYYVTSPDVMGDDFDPDEELTYRTLAFCIREEMPDAGYCSPAEFWAEVVVPHIVAGRIRHAVWGIVSEGAES